MASIASAFLVGAGPSGTASFLIAGVTPAAGSTRRRTVAVH
jgi:hypothetical protein